MILKEIAIMVMRKIKVDDMVVILCGKDKGRTGKVLRFKGKDKVVVEGVNVIKKHLKPNPHKNIEGGIVERESAIHVSNVGLLNPVTKKADRVGFKRLENGKKVRIFKSNKEQVEI